MAKHDIEFSRRTRKEFGNEQVGSAKEMAEDLLALVATAVKKEEIIAPAVFVVTDNMVLESYLGNEHLTPTGFAALTSAVRYQSNLGALGVGFVAELHDKERLVNGDLKSIGVVVQCQWFDGSAWEISCLFDDQRNLVDIHGSDDFHSILEPVFVRKNELLN